MKVITNTQTPAEIEAQAHDLARAEKWSAAAQLLLKAARAEPHNVALWTQAASWQRQMRDPKLAAKTLQRAIYLNTPQPLKSRVSVGKAGDKGLIELYMALTEIQFDQQDWEGCLQSCAHVLRMAPRHHFALEVKATALLQSGRLSEAVETMRTLLQISPRDPLHRLKYATLLQLEGQSGAALEEFGRVVAAFPDAPFSGDARDAMDLLDTMQIQQIVMRASEQDLFRLQLQRDFDETLSEHGFSLSDNGRESLRHMFDDGRMERDTKPPRIH